MKQKTINKYIAILEDVIKSKKSLHAYCKENTCKYNNITKLICSIKKNGIEGEDAAKLIELYDSITKVKNNKEIVEKIETDVVAETSFTRDDEGRIKFYNYQIYRRNKSPLTGSLTREEMNTIYRLYSYYGDALTQRMIARHFADLSLIDFKRILRAFNITKASSPFAPHMYEELSEEELRNIQLREKENSFLRKAEEDQIRNNEKLLKKYAQENIELKDKLKNATFTVNVGNIPTKEINGSVVNNKIINLYLSDMHIGASLNSYPLYTENNNYNKDEIIRRLSCILLQLAPLGKFEQINLVLLGDNVDCCGVQGKTARLDHDMPESMDPREQANTFLDVMMWFIGSLINFNCKLHIYSVPNGNHGGNFEYICNKALFNGVNAAYKNIETTLWDEYYGVFEVSTSKFIVCHGKDAQFMKKPMPLNLNDSTKVMLYEWLDSKGIYGDNIHIIKGDLHSNTLSSCKKLTYRNVLSLFGASDYSNMNYSRNSYGMSFDIIYNETLLRGTFENI